jgi:hypothetical protein
MYSSMPEDKDGPKKFYLKCSQKRLVNDVPASDDLESMIRTSADAYAEYNKPECSSIAFQRPK